MDGWCHPPSVDAEQAAHTSAYDRAKARRGEKLPSAAFDLKPIPTEEAGRKIRQTPVDELREERKRKRRNPSGRKILRDDWLSPLTLSPETLSDHPQVHTGGVRSSDRGFLNIAWKDYWGLLRWTAKQSIGGVKTPIPKSLQRTLTQLGIDVSMWRDLVWDWQKYFGKSSCVGRPESIKQHAKQAGKHHHRGQASVAGCFA